MSWVIVTGANGGIGAATVHELIKNNYSVYAADLADKPHESFAAYGDAIFRYRSVNVSDEESVRALARAAAEVDEPIQGAVLAAGIVHSKPLLDTSFEDWKRLHAVNADGVFLCLREFARVMIEQMQTSPENTRSLVTVASNAARVPRAEFGAYGASKASAVRVSSSFGLQLARHGIRVNTVCPGTTRTPMVTDAWNGEDLSALPVRLERRRPQRPTRGGQPRDFPPGNSARAHRRPRRYCGGECLPHQRCLTAYHHAKYCCRWRRNLLADPKGVISEQ